MDSEHRIPVGSNSTAPRNISRATNQKTVAPVPLPITSHAMKSPSLSFPARRHDSDKPQTTSKKSIATASFLDTVITISLVALFFGTPLFFTGVTLQGIAFEKELYFYFWMLIGLVSWVSKGVITGEMHIKKTPLDIPIAVFFIVYVLSAAYSVDKWHSFWGAFGDPSRGVLAVFSFIVVYYFILSHVNARRIQLLFASFLTSVFFVMIWSLLVALGVHFLPGSLEKFIPLTLTGSFTAQMILIGSSLPLYVSALLLLQSNTRHSMISRYILSTMMFISIIGIFVLLALFFSYVSWLAIIGGFAIFLLYVLAKVIRIQERWMWMPMVVLIALLLLFMIAPQNLLKTSIPVEATPGLKLSWEIAKESLKENLFIGSGPATYGYNFSLFRPQIYNMQPLHTLRFTQASGLIFEAISTAGLLGTIALIIFLLTFVSVGFYLLTQKKEKGKLLSLGLWSMVIVLLVASLTTQFNGALMIISVLMASFTLAVLQYESEADDAYLHLSFASSPKYALALAFVFLVVSAGVAFTFSFIGKAFWADRLAAQSLQTGLGDAQGIEKMTRAVQLMPYESQYRRFLGQIYLTMATQELSKPESERDVELLKNYVISANDFAKMSRQMSLNDVVAQETYAQVLENSLFVSGISEETLKSVEKAYQDASALEPHNPYYYIKLGQIKKTLANAAKDENQKTLIDDAQKLFQKAIDEKSDLQIAYYNKALTQEVSGSLDDAVNTLIQGIKVDQENKDASDLKFVLARVLRERGREDDLKGAEAILNEMIKSDDQNINAHIMLGLTEEQMNKKDSALQSYQKALSLVSGPDADSAKKQVQTFIDNVKNGKSNIIDTKKEAAPAALPLTDSVPADNSASDDLNSSVTAGEAIINDSALIPDALPSTDTSPLTTPSP